MAQPGMNAAAAGPAVPRSVAKHSVGVIFSGLMLVLLDDHDTQRLPEVQQLLEQLCVELSGELRAAAGPAAS